MANADTTCKHLLSIEELKKKELMSYVFSADSFVEISERNLKKVPALRGKTVINLFLEPSTRTRVSFEIAGKRLSADTINISGSGSSVSKGESLLDMARTLEAMKPDVVVIRHQSSGAAHYLANELTETSLVNAGDGMHEHPTQALLDLLTLYRYYVNQQEDGARIGSEVLEGKKIAIVGDVRHSRVARSNIWAHLHLGNEVRLVAPSTLLPKEFEQPSAFGGKVKLYHDLRAGLEGVDIIMILRMQLERQESFFVPSLEEYTRLYCVSNSIINECAPIAVVLHPGPVNRGVEISRDVIDSPRSLINEQVKHGVAVRMAVLFHLATGGISSEAANTTEEQKAA